MKLKTLIARCTKSAFIVTKKGFFSLSLSCTARLVSLTLHWRTGHCLASDATLLWHLIGWWSQVLSSHWSHGHWPAPGGVWAPLSAVRGDRVQLHVWGSQWFSTFHNIQASQAAGRTGLISPSMHPILAHSQTHSYNAKNIISKKYDFNFNTKIKFALSFARAIWDINFFPI